MSKWGDKDNSVQKEFDESGARGKIVARGAFPCLNTLYPGKFRAHCSKCGSDASVGLFTRMKGVFIAAFSEKEEKEVIYRLPVDVANNLVKKLALGSIKFGDLIYHENGVMNKSGKNMSGDEKCVQELDDSRPGLAMAFVNGETPMLPPETPVYILEGSRMSPYLMHYHEKATPSKRDVTAYLHKFSLECIETFDEEYDAMLDGKTGTF